jgi:preprotein translocase subunit SecG
MNRSGSATTRGLLVVVAVLVGLAIAAFVLVHVGGGHGIEKL